MPQDLQFGPGNCQRPHLGHLTPKVISLCAFFVDYLATIMIARSANKIGSIHYGARGKILALQWLGEGKEPPLNIFIVFLGIFLNM
jgi:hypothetical protein